MTIATSKRRSAARQMIDLARRRGDGGVAFLPGAAQAGMHWLARDCGLGVSLNPTAGTLGPDSVTRPAAAWLAAYVESTASTPAAVDGPVGFLSDGEGTVGAELCSNPGGPFSTTAGWATFNGASLSATGGNLVITNGNFGGVVSALATTNGQTYRVVIAVAGSTGSSLQANVLGTVVTLNVGLNPVVVVASTNQITAYLNSATAGQTLLLSSVSCKPLTGRHATQATGPNKPVMRRGITNLLTYSGDLTNAAWTKGATTVSTGAADPQGGTSAQKVIPTAASAEHYFVNSYAMGAGPYTVALLMSAQGLRYLAARGTLDGTTYRNLGFDLQTGTVTAGGTFGIGSIAPAGNGYYLCAVSLTRTAGTTTLFVEPGNAPFSSDASQIWTSDGVAGFGFAGGGIFNGTLTAQQILALGGIPLTTTVAASSSGGNFALEFDGTKQMGLASVPFAASDDHIVVVGARVDDVSGQRTLYAHSNASNHQLPWIYYGTNGKINAVYWDGATTVTLTSPLSYTGQDVVVSIRRLGSTAVLRVNGTQVATASLASMTSPALTTAMLGGFNGANLQHKGRIFGTLAFKGAFSDAELMVLDRGVASLCPIPSLRF